jgi:hypothetical protein
MNDDVMAQTEQGPRERSGIRLGHEIDHPLAFGLGRNRLEGGKSAPGFLLHACCLGDFEPLRESCQQLEKEPRKKLEKARGGVEPNSMRAFGQNQERNDHRNPPPSATSSKR